MPEIKIYAFNSADASDEKVTEFTVEAPQDLYEKVITKMLIKFEVEPVKGGKTYVLHGIDLSEEVPIIEVVPRRN